MGAEFDRALIKFATSIERNAKPRKPGLSTERWPRFQVSRRKGVTVVRLVDPSLVWVQQIEEMGADLFDLIEAGNHRIVINFGNVERLASLTAAYLFEANRNCLSEAGGTLRVCLLGPQLSVILVISVLGRALRIYPDEATALEVSWPPRVAPKRLPTEILSILKLDMKHLNPQSIERGVNQPPDSLRCRRLCVLLKFGWLPEENQTYNVRSKFLLVVS